MNFTARPLSTTIDSNSLAIQRFSSARVSFNALDDGVPCQVTARSTDTNECLVGAPSTGSVNGQASHRLHLFALQRIGGRPAVQLIGRRSEPQGDLPAIIGSFARIVRMPMRPDNSRALKMPGQGIAATNPYESQFVRLHRVHRQ